MARANGGVKVIYATGYYVPRAGRHFMAEDSGGKAAPLPSRSPSGRLMALAGLFRRSSE